MTLQASAQEDIARPAVKGDDEEDEPDNMQGDCIHTPSYHTSISQLTLCVPITMCAVASNSSRI